jgi:hypothetical protein
MNGRQLLGSPQLQVAMVGGGLTVGGVWGLTTMSGGVAAGFAAIVLLLTVWVGLLLLPVGLLITPAGGYGIEFTHLQRRLLAGTVIAGFATPFVGAPLLFVVVTL